MEEMGSSIVDDQTMFEPSQEQTDDSLTQTILNMRYGNPPKFDRRPLMTKWNIGEELGVALSTVNNLLMKFQKDFHIDFSGRNDANAITYSNLTEELKEKIIKLRHGEPPRFDTEPLMSQENIGRTIGSGQNLVSVYLKKFYAENGI